MKKAVALFALAIMLSAGSSSNAAVTDTLLMYIPNRAVDFVDCFSATVGFGPAIEGRAWVTRWLSFGGGIGATAKVVKQINRQYGTCLDSGWNAHFMVISAEAYEIEKCSRGVKKYYQYSTGVPLPGEKIYDIHNGERDFWSIGAEGAVLGQFSFEIHPIEMADFITGIFFIDLKGDDIKGSDLRN